MQTISKNTSPKTGQDVNRLDLVWSNLTRADRFALLGHDHEVLSAADKIRLARAAEQINRNRKNRPRRNQRVR